MRSELKTKKKSSGERSWSPLVKISARSDEVRGMFYLAQFGSMHEKPILRKTRNKVDQYIFSPRKVESLVSKDFMDSLSWRIRWAYLKQFPRNWKFRRFSEKQISRKIERNLTVSPIELIQTGMELSSPSLSSGHINKDKIFRKVWTKKEGGGTLNRELKSPSPTYPLQCV